MGFGRVIVVVVCLGGLWTGKVPVIKRKGEGRSAVGRPSSTKTPIPRSVGSYSDSEWAVTLFRRILDAFPVERDSKFELFGEVEGHRDQQHLWSVKPQECPHAGGAR
jgi:hypothetical protein